MLKTKKTYLVRLFALIALVGLVANSGLLSLSPGTENVEPITIDVHAAAVVPLFQYIPPTIADPTPPRKIEPLMAKYIRTGWFCGYNQLHKKINALGLEKRGK